MLFQRASYLELFVPARERRRGDDLRGGLRKRPQRHIRRRILQGGDQRLKLLRQELDHLAGKRPRVIGVIAALPIANIGEIDAQVGGKVVIDVPADDADAREASLGKTAALGPHKIVLIQKVGKHRLLPPQRVPDLSR